jgi:hypothetical protein
MEVPMISIEWLRDLTICIAGLLSTAAIIFMAILVFTFYRRLKPILESVKTTAATVEGISSCIRDDLVRPLAEIVAIIQGLKQGITAISNMFKERQKGGDSNE